MESVQVCLSWISAWLHRVVSSKSLLIAAGQMSISSQALYAQIITMFKVPLVPQQVRNLSGIMIGPKTTKIKMNCLNRKMQISLIVMNLETLMSGREETSNQLLRKKKNRPKLRMNLETLLQMKKQRKVSKKALL